MTSKAAKLSIRVRLDLTLIYASSMPEHSCTFSGPRNTYVHIRDRRRPECFVCIRGDSWNTAWLSMFVARQSVSHIISLVNEQLKEDLKDGA